jgi:hypothetical protein
VTPAWRTELRRRLAAAGVTVDAKYEPAATRILDRELDRRVRGSYSAMQARSSARCPTTINWRGR